MAIPSTPATPEQMQVEALKELDRMRTMSIQSLAMQRIRDSVVTLSRETGFRERPVEQFAQAPLYIPKYQQWSSTLNKIVGTPMPSLAQPVFTGGAGNRFWAARNQAMTAMSILQGTYVPGAGQQPQTVEDILRGLETSRYGRETRPWANYVREYQAWQQAQRTLPV